MSKNVKPQIKKRKKLASAKALGKQKTTRATSGDFTITKYVDKPTP